MRKEFDTVRVQRKIDFVCRTLTLSAIFMMLLTAGTCDYCVEVGQYFADSNIIVVWVTAILFLIASWLLDSHRNEVIKWVEILSKM